jgi:tetratricopeptide (TPR) repeat protein
MRKIAFLGLGVCFFLTTGLFPQNSFLKGEEFFLANLPGEALPLLEAAVAEDSAHVRAALYLGMAYTQLGRNDEAITAFRRILPRAGNQSALVAFNLGNVYFIKGESVFAEQFYTQAIREDPSYAPAWLNRANARVKNGNLTDAVSDYEHYLVLEPLSPKRASIESLVRFIRDEFRTAEERRLAAEQEAAAVAERRRLLLEEVSASLQAAAEETRGLSAGSENVLGYEGEFELE